MWNCGWDTETHLIGQPDIIPRKVCSSWDVGAEGVTTPSGQQVYSNGDEPLFGFLFSMWEKALAQEMRVIIHNASFDVSVGLRYCYDVIAGAQRGDPHKAKDLLHLIWETLELSLHNEWERCGPILVSDTLIREKLLHLSEHGSLNVYRGRNIDFSLAGLVKRHLKKDIYAAKVTMGAGGRIFDSEGNDITDTDKAASAWRLRYRELDGLPTSQWPRGPWIYALEDSTYARLVWDIQEQRGDKRPEACHSTIRSEALQVYSSICLAICTANGFRVDTDQVQRVSKEIRDQLERIEPVMIANGLLRTNGSRNMKVVKERVEALWNQLGRQPLLTDSGDIATNKEVMEILSTYDPPLQLYAEHNKLAKLRDAFLPSLQESRVYSQFDVLKETGRTSSFGSREKKGRKPFYNAVNSQQIPRQVGIRECFLPPYPDMYIDSVDYKALELCSVAQKTYSLLGWSVHRDKINAGYDLHSYLGSAIAMLKEPELVGHLQDVRQLDIGYAYLRSHLDYRAPDGYENWGRKDSEIEDRLHLKKRAKHMRNMAKPTGLGYPGGLAEGTMVVFAKTVYKVVLTLQEAAELKELWFAIYPEMVEYFKWVRQSRDMVNKDEHGDYRYGYVTPGFDRYRAGATYCATANGAAMQSLSADGAKRGLSWIGRAAAGGLPEDSVYRILDTSAHLTFIHDENLVAIPIDAAATERSMAVSKLMVAAMQIHMPDVRIEAEPALMKRWRKAAEPEWRDVPGQQQAAYEVLCAQYGPDMAGQMMTEFSPPDGKRLLCYEDIHGEEIR